MLNEAKETKSPTGNRMGMKFSPELVAALLVPSAVVSPLVLDEIGKPKPKDEKALQKLVNDSGTQTNVGGVVCRDVVTKTGAVTDCILNRFK